MKFRAIAAWLLIVISPAVLADPIERVEPPSWWTGFRHTELQLLVHGDDISTWSTSVDGNGVSITRIEKGDSPNYLFIYLDLSDAQPGSFDLVFSKSDERLTHTYELRERVPGHVGTYDSSDVIYLLTPDRFANGDPGNDTIDGMGDPVDRGNPDGRHGGDIQGIIDRLDYIKGLGFTAIWLNPLLENDMPAFSYHGYSTTDFYAVDPRYGSNELYRQLVAGAREKGVGVIMDMIVNHIGSEHWWMADLPTDDWLNFQENPRITSHEHITEQDPYASGYDIRMYSDGWFVVPGMPDLNQRNPLLADYLTQNGLWWIEYLGLAGIRMDTWPYPDKHYMSEWSRRIMEEYPDFNIVGEEWTDNQAAVAYWQRGEVNRDGYVSYLPSLMDFPLQEAVWLGLTTEHKEELFDNSPGGMERMYRRLSMDFLYPDPDALVIFPDNHDMDRIFTQLGEDHDLWRMAMAYFVTMRGVPQIYYGTEILMDSTDDSSHGNIRSDFPGGWAGDPKNAFTGAGMGERELEAQAFLRTLLNWRKDAAVVHRGKTMHFVPEDRTYVYFRYDDEDSVMVVLNKNTETVQLGLERFSERLDGYSRAQDAVTGQTQALEGELALPPRSVLVLDLD
mgnify:CR=1 FL=1